MIDIGGSSHQNNTARVIAGIDSRPNQTKGSIEMIGNKTMSILGKDQ